MNMKIGSSRLSALVAPAVYALCAGTGIAQSDVEQRTPQVRIYASAEINVSRYEVVGRPCVDSWRSSLWVPTYPSRELAIAALQTEAARRGADGLLNVNCLDQGHWKWSSSTEPAFLCYGIAIRVRPGQG
jgi:hypothetical protein